jgi:hypothetical protein
MYAGAGYHFLFRTDHWVPSQTHLDDNPYPLLWLDGIELDGPDETGAWMHIACLGAFTGISYESGLTQSLHAVRQQGGLLILAHPHWMGNTFEDALRWQFDGVEVYNHVCQWMNGKGYGGVYWNAMLQHDPNTLAFAVDDTHLVPSHPGWNGGWVMVNAPQCTPEAILSAIRAGNYYSSCGPEFYDLRYDGSRLSLRCSPVQFIRLVGPRYLGQRRGSFDGALIDRAVFDLPQDWSYAYLEIEDDHGRRAWSNTLLVGMRDEG